jgi:hypothetical protein
MSKPDLRAIVDLHLDFIVQNVSTTTSQCHFTDGWGASSSDPVGQEGLQDCLLGRYQLCAEKAERLSHTQGWFDYSVCLFRNQKETDTITDRMHKFEATLEYCSDVTGFDHQRLKACAEGQLGAHLLSESHTTEVKLNPGRAGGKIKSVPPQWIAINGKNTPSSADWVQAVCDAYTGSPKPASCAKAIVV